jgi:hypothetical protein
MRSFATQIKEAGRNLNPCTLEDAARRRHRRDPIFGPADCGPFIIPAEATNVLEKLASHPDPTVAVEGSNDGTGLFTDVRAQDRSMQRFLFILTPYREKRAICKLLRDLLTKVFFLPPATRMLLAT